MAGVKLYLDENVEPALAHVLRERGFDVISAHEMDLTGKTDQDQLEFAISQKRAILTFDSKDFAPLAEKYYKNKRDHYGIILSAQYNITLKELISLSTNLLNKLHQNDLKNIVVWLQSFR